MSTVYKNCKLCNAVFASIDGAVICDRCMSSEGELYKHIRDYLYEHPGLSAAELANELKISMSRITQFIQNGRFELIPLRDQDEGKRQQK